jgi:hypothetical protein
MVTPQLSIGPASAGVFRNVGSMSHETLLEANELEIKIFIERPEIKIVR